MKTVPHVSIILLNWNGWKDTIDCLESLYQINYSNYDIIIVDNNSEDDSIEQIKKYCNGKLKVEPKFFHYKFNNKPIQLLEYFKDETKDSKVIEEFKGNSFNRLMLIKNDRNYGFAEGNNIGIRYALRNLNPEFILLLNNDTIVDPFFLNELVNKTENAGIIGSKLYFYDNKNIVQSFGVKIRWSRGEMASLGYGSKYESENYDNNLDAVSGCSMLIKKEVVDKIGFLNTKCFLYYEDTDFCIRAKKAGFKIVCADKSKVWHKTSVSSKKISGTREYYSARNLFLFMRKYANNKQFYSFLLYFFCFKFWFTIAVILVYHREISAFIPFVKGVLEGLKKSYW